MAELEGDGQGSGTVEGWGREKIAEAFGIGLHIRRQLEEQEAEFSGLAHGFEDTSEIGDVGFAVVEPLDMGDALWGFEAEAKERWCCGKPVLQHGCCGESAEGVVHLDGTELGGVELEEALLGESFRVEGRLPCGVGPAGSASEDP